MAADLCTAQDMIDRLDGGEEELRRLAGDDGTGSYRATAVAKAIEEASEEGYEILLSGFDTVVRVQFLIANDSRAKNAICHLVRFHLTDWKNEFRLPDGSTIFSKSAREARDLLREKARGGRRTSAEEATPNGPGESSLLRPRTATTIPSVLLDRVTGKPVGF